MKNMKNVEVLNKITEYKNKNIVLDFDKNSDNIKLFELMKLTKTDEEFSSIVELFSGNYLPINVISSYTMYILNGPTNIEKSNILTVKEFEELLDTADMLVIDNSPSINIAKIKRDSVLLLKANWILNNSHYEVILKKEDIDTIEKREYDYIINDTFIINVLKIIYL